MIYKNERDRLIRLVCRNNDKREAMKQLEIEQKLFFTKLS